VAVQIQWADKTKAEYIKYFDYVNGAGIVSGTTRGVLDRSVLGASLKSLAL